MQPATKGGSVSQPRQRLKEKKLKQTMEGRARDVQRVNRELRVDGTAGRDGEQTTEVTRLLRELVTEVARVHRGDSETAAYSDPCSPQDLAAALPIWKRFLDLAIVSALLPLWLPVMIFVAIWVAVTSPGPVFYRQPRIGFKARRFMLVKFRTMKVNAETHIHEAYLEHLIVSDRPMIKLDMTGDPRLILGGRFLRATGLDELPQLFNVLKGEMSLVGPRPCTVGEFESYAPAQRARVNALPGLTGLWQVNGKNRTTFREMIEMDIFYARNICFSLDIKIILRTLPALVVQFYEIVQPISRPAVPPTPPVKT
jgi:lipopolysaccharide/colanic/teichoic acid biosynthesis glycosyltransferase